MEATNWPPRHPPFPLRGSGWGVIGARQFLSARSRAELVDAQSTGPLGADVEGSGSLRASACLNLLLMSEAGAHVAAEARARVLIDGQLTAAGWVVQNKAQMNQP